MPFFFCRGEWKVCIHCAFVGRKDNVKGQHFTRGHRELKATKDTEYYLKVGRRPRVGTKHVIDFLDHMGSKAQRPESKAKTSVTKKATKAKQPEEEQ